MDARSSLEKAVDRARALYRGMHLVGHRHSIIQGRILWAIPGGDVADSAKLARHDTDFIILDEPSRGSLKKSGADIAKARAQVAAA